MKGDPRNPADWFKLAGMDIIRAERDLAAKDCHAACFWLQQSAEKALKGWLISTGWELIKTHDLVRLCSECSVAGRDFTAYLPSLARLKSLYFSDRYVDDSPDPDPDTAECAVLLSEVKAILASASSSHSP
jgi:HEPN domain-containing protein